MDKLTLEQRVFLLGLGLQALTERLDDLEESLTTGSVNHARELQAEIDALREDNDRLEALLGTVSNELRGTALELENLRGTR